MAKVEYTWDDAFFQAVLKSPEVRQAVDEAASRGEAIARGIAPVKTGRYRDSMTHETFTGQRRCYAYVYSDVDYSIPVELYHGTMTKAAAQMGA